MSYNNRSPSFPHDARHRGAAVGGGRTARFTRVSRHDHDGMNPIVAALLSYHRPFVYIFLMVHCCLLAAFYPFSMGTRYFNERGELYLFEYVPAEQVFGVNAATEAANSDEFASGARGATVLYLNRPQYTRFIAPVLILANALLVTMLVGHLGHIFGAPVSLLAPNVSWAQAAAAILLVAISLAFQIDIALSDGAYWSTGPAAFLWMLFVVSIGYWFLYVSTAPGIPAGMKFVAQLFGGAMFGVGPWLPIGILSDTRPDQIGRIDPLVAMFGPSSLLGWIICTTVVLGLAAVTLRSLSFHSRTADIGGHSNSLFGLSFSGGGFGELRSRNEKTIQTPMAEYLQRKRFETLTSGSAWGQSVVRSSVYEQGGPITWKSALLLVPAVAAAIAMGIGLILILVKDQFPEGFPTPYAQILSISLVAAPLIVAMHALFVVYSRSRTFTFDALLPLAHRDLQRTMWASVRRVFLVLAMVQFVTAVAWASMFVSAQYSLYLAILVLVLCGLQLSLGYLLARPRPIWAIISTAIVAYLSVVAMMAVGGVFSWSQVKEFSLAVIMNEMATMPVPMIHPVVVVPLTVAVVALVFQFLARWRWDDFEPGNYQ